MNEKLKPCPFCGGEASIFSNAWEWKAILRGDRYSVRCVNELCHVFVCGNPMKTKEAASAAWNMREGEKNA